MANILILNPSVNMRLAAMEMKMYGINVQFSYSLDIPVSHAERVFYFLSGVNISTSLPCSRHTAPCTTLGCL